VLVGRRRQVDDDEDDEDEDEDVGRCFQMSGTSP
jgi:hypothetical protein